jgi:hypothetical protein
VNPELGSIATWLQATGPYGLVAVLGWAFWRMNERKDAAIRELYEQVAELSRVQTAAITKMESALVALKDAITQLKSEPERERRDNCSAE